MRLLAALTIGAILIRTRYSSTITCVLFTTMLLLGACSKAEDHDVLDEATIIPESHNSSSSSSTKSEKISICSFISAADVDAALGGKLALGPSKEIRNGCSFPVQFGFDGNFLSYSRLSRGHYDANKNWEKQKGIKFEYINGLGQQAFILNDGQVCVLVNETDAFIVRAQIVSMGEELPFTQEELGAGLIEIARKVEPHF